MAYLKFAAMIATSTVAMYVMMYLNTYSLDHVLWSQTRAWMALYMGAGMAVIMLRRDRPAQWRRPVTPLGRLAGGTPPDRGRTTPQCQQRL